MPHTVSGLAASFRPRGHGTRSFMPIGAIACALLAAIVAIGCASPAHSDRAARPSESVAPGAVVAGLTVDAATEDRILALVPERVSRQAVEQTLALGPA